MVQGSRPKMSISVLESQMKAQALTGEPINPNYIPIDTIEGTIAPSDFTPEYFDNNLSELMNDLDVDEGRRNGLTDYSVSEIDEFDNDSDKETRFEHRKNYEIEKDTVYDVLDGLPDFGHIRAWNFLLTLLALLSGAALGINLIMSSAANKIVGWLLTFQLFIGLAWYRWKNTKSKRLRARKHGFLWDISNFLFKNKNEGVNEVHKSFPIDLSYQSIRRSPNIGRHKSTNLSLHSYKNPGHRNYVSPKQQAEVTADMFEKRPYVKVTVHGCLEKMALIDTGASGNVISAEMVRELEKESGSILPRLSTDCVVKGLGNMAVPHEGVVLLSIGIGGCIFKLEPFLISQCPNSSQLILGTRLIIREKLIPTFKGDELVIEFKKTK